MELIKNRTDILIAGAGIAGCAAAQKLESEGADYLLIEKNCEPGGLTRSISVGDAHFDYTGHFMHLARCKSPEALPFAHQKNEDWMIIRRKSAVYIEGKMVTAPFQYNLYHLPAMIREACIKEYRSRPNIKDARSFREYLLTGFGKGICESFLFPYNEKLMARDISEFSSEYVTRFFPLPDTERIENGYVKGSAHSETAYNSSFWYPQREGIGLLAKGLANGLNAMQTCCALEHVDIAKRCAQTRLGEIKYEKMLTSLPLKKFCYLTDNPLLHSLAEKLRHTYILCLNLLLKAPPSEKFEGNQWIYIPEKGIPFYRIGIYTHISPYMNPQNTTALYIESAFMDTAPYPSINPLIDMIFQSLEASGWAKREKCRVISASWIECAYVHFDFLRKETVKGIMDILKEHSIYPIGRYGLWDYISMEDAILSGIETARSVLL